MLLTIWLIILCAFFAPFASSLATHRILQDRNCEECRNLGDPLQYGHENCCEPEDIDDFCYDAFQCYSNGCADQGDIGAVCPDFNCGLCLEFAENVTDECCPFFNFTTYEPISNDPNLETCLNTLGAFQFSCLLSDCLGEDELPWVQNEIPCETGPTVSPRPTQFPTSSPAPTSSAAPTRSCTCCDCIHSSGCNPDPHYAAWNNEVYDFQGGCDQIAIDNPIIQLQIRTRPRGYYSTVTEVGLFFKAHGEVFHMNTTGQATFNITNGASVTQLAAYSGYDIVFAGNPDSFIRVTNYFGNIAIQAMGNGYIFSDSEGMFGSWNHGGVRFRNGTLFDTSGGWAATRERSIELALDWMVQPNESLFLDPSVECDGSRNCGPGETFLCDATRRLETEKCEKSCDDIPNEIAKSACEEDLVILNGDNTFTCQPAYIEPLIVEADSCDFEKLDDDMCTAKGITCATMDGFCQVNCVESETHACLPGLCSDKYKGKNKAGKGAKDRKLKNVFDEECMCYAPRRCAA